MSMSLSEEFLKRFVNQVFVETGTYDGAGVKLALKVGFKVCHTIELDPGRVARSRQELAEFPNAIVYEGDTVDVLPSILKNLSQRATIFLDAHPVGETDNCKIGKYRHPVLRELELVRQSSIRVDHTIIVDDRHDFAIYRTTDDEVIGLIKKINPVYDARVEGDTIVATISP